MKASGGLSQRDPPVGWRDFLPPDQQVDARERWRAAFGALLGVLLTAGLCLALTPAHDSTPWLVAPIGASAVLVFALPASPFAQPWNVVGGNALSAFVGIACMQWLGSTPIAAALAVGAAIALMFALRCLHPPGGACALLTVMGSIGDPSFVLQPVLLNSVLLVLAGVAYNRASGHAYPLRSKGVPPKTDEMRRRSFTDADLDAVLARYNRVLDVSRDDLRMLLEQAQMQSWRRRSGQVRCAEVMSPEPIAVNFGTPLQEAWTLLRQHRIKSLPVVDRAQRLVGIVTHADFMREARVEAHADWPSRLATLIRPTPAMHSDKAETVGQIMARQVRVVSQDRPIGDLLPLFCATGHHHVPVIDGDRRLVGMITQSDVVRALARAE